MPMLLLELLLVSSLSLFVVLIVCLLFVVKYKHKKNSSGEDVNYTAATAACFLFTVVVFPQLQLTMFAGFNLPQRAGLF